MTEKKFDEIMVELKGEKMKSLAEIWQERGEIRGKKKGRLEGKLEIFYKNIKLILKKQFKEVGEKIFNKLLVMNDAKKFEIFVQKTIKE